MATTISADNGSVSGSAGLKSSADSSGVLVLQSGANTTAVTIDASQNVALASLTASKPVFTDASKNFTNTGTTPAANGGTGFASYAVGDLLYADTTTTLAKLADVATGNALISGGVSTAPSWGKIGLTTHVSGTLPVANGGTGVTTSTGSGNSVLSTSPTIITPVVRNTVSVIGTSTAAVASTTYVLTASLTLTLPASPTAGDWVKVNNSSGTTTAVIGRNAQNIQSLAQDMTIDNATASFMLTYADATRGWVLTL
jgi:hypothetical protein